jgi:hypothetical protein
MSEADGWDVEQTEDAPEDEQEPALEYEIMNYPADITLGGYVDLWDRKELKIPDFQRAYVWDRVKASKLIESFLLGLPVPGTFLYKERDKPGYLIIDGQQRIFSIVRFIKGVFDDNVFRLKNVDPRYAGKAFSDLSDDEQFRLKGLTLRATIIQQINPNDDTSIYHIFERLNTGGVNLNPMEVRQCVSYGPLVKALKELNEHPAWREILGMPKPDKRLRDVELALRCIAMAENGENYEKPMKGFLNQYMEKRRGDPDDFTQLVINFRESCDYVLQSLGAKPFHLKGRLNYSALDSIMAWVLVGLRPKNLSDRFAKLRDDDEFQSAISFNTSDESVVSQRLERSLRSLED